MAFHTIWSVDLGKSALKAVRLRREKNSVEILAVDKVDYPISQNGVDGAEASKEALSIFRSRNEIRDPLVVSHPGQGTFSRFIKVPAFDEKKVQDMVQYEATQQIPFPLDEVIWDFHLVDREYLSGEERDVGLFAVRREAIDDFLLDFVQEGLSVDMLPIGYLALFNYVKYDLKPEVPSVVLDIGAAHTDLILIDGDRFWIRALPHSGQDVTRAIMERFKLKYAEAERLKTAAAKVPEQAAKIFKIVIQPKLKELVQEIHRSIGYYRSQSDEANFERLYLLGNASRVIGMKKYLQDQLGMKVHRVQSIHHLRISREVNVKLLQSQLPAFGTALGAGIQALGAGACDVDLVPREEKLKKAAERKKKHVYFAALIVLGAILLSFALIRGKVSDAERALQSAQQLPREQITAHERELSSLQKKSRAELLDAQRAALVRLGETRQSVLDGLRIFDEVLTKLPTAQVIDEIVTVDDEGGEERVREEAKQLLESKLWVPWVHIQRVQWPEDPEAVGGSSRGASSRRATEEKKKDKVPAYKFEAFAMIPFRAGAAESIGDIQERLVSPLAGQLAVSDATVFDKVEIGSGTQDLSSLVQEPGKQSPPIDQEGRPFFGAPLTWYLVPRAPADMLKKEDEDDEDLEGDEEYEDDEDYDYEDEDY
jgi:type IV pilus assembly protein PilM